MKATTLLVTLVCTLAIVSVCIAEDYCPECGLAFKDKSFVDKHIKASHPELAKPEKKPTPSKFIVDDDDLDLDDLLNELGVEKQKASTAPKSSTTSSSAKTTTPLSSSVSLHGNLLGPGQSATVKKTKYGFMTFSPLDNTHGRALNTYGQYSDGEAQVFGQLLRPGDNVIDAGANVGMFSVYFAQLVAPHGQVHAFEPQRRIYHQLAGNAALNNLDNLYTYHAALGKSKGSIAIPPVDFRKEGCHGCTKLDPSTATSSTTKMVTSNGNERARLMTIDSLELSNCRFIKIDVNGMELEVLIGGRRTIEQTMPILYVTNTRDSRSLEVVRHLDSIGYSCYWSISPCFAADNYFGESKKVFAEYCAHVNMICTHVDSDVNIVGETDKVPVPPPGATDARAVYGTNFDFIDSSGDGLGFMNNEDLFGSAYDATAEKTLDDILAGADDDDDELFGSPPPRKATPPTTQKAMPEARKQQPVITERQPASSEKQQQQQQAKPVVTEKAASKPVEKKQEKPVVTEKQPPKQQQQQAKPKAALSELDALLGDDNEEDFDAWMSDLKKKLGV